MFPPVYDLWLTDSFLLLETLVTDTSDVMNSSSSTLVGDTKSRFVWEGFYKLPGNEMKMIYVIFFLIEMDL